MCGKCLLDEQCALIIAAPGESSAEDSSAEFLMLPGVPRREPRPVYVSPVFSTAAATLMSLRPWPDGAPSNSLLIPYKAVGNPPKFVTLDDPEEKELYRLSRFYWKEAIRCEVPRRIWPRGSPKTGQ